MSLLLRERNVALLWGGQVLSLLGDWALFVGLPFYVYGRTGSTLAMGAMFIAQAVPSILFGSLGGVLADHWDRRRTMIAADLARALLLPGLFLLQYWPDWFWLIYPVTFLETTIGQLYYPARTALVPQLLPKEKLLAINALSGQTIALASLLGPALGGWLAQTGGLAAIVGVDSASYAASALLACFIQTIPGRSGLAMVTQEKRRTLWVEWWSGMRVLCKARPLLLLFASIGLITLTQGIVNVLLVVYVRDMLHCGTQTYGWLASAQGIGGLFGGWLLTRLDRRMTAGRFILIGAGLAGLCLLIRDHTVLLLPALVLTAMAGLGAIFASSSEQTLLQSMTDEHYRGRILGSWTTMQAVMMLLGMSCASLLGNQQSALFILDAAGGLLIIAALLSIYI